MSSTTTFCCVWLNLKGYMFWPYMQVIFRPLQKHWIHFYGWEIWNGSCINTALYVPCHSLDSWSPTSHDEGLGLIPRQSMWDLWWTLWPGTSFSVFALLALINCHFTNAPYSFICEVGLVNQAHQQPQYQGIWSLSTQRINTEEYNWPS